jgi:hypothetical protein
VVIDATDTFYIDHDVLELIRDFNGVTSKEKNIEVTLRGFKEDYKMESSLQHVSSTQ